MPHDLDWSRQIGGEDFVADFLIPEIQRLLEDLDNEFPRTLVILGNDDPRLEEASIESAEALGVWTYPHGRKIDLYGFRFYG